jgi:8-oxo-dGTP pyrophosphatase MutT (NUDIX family)
LNEKHELVLVQQGQGSRWSFPKGHVEEGESPLEAARREIYEECGLTELAYVRELGSYQRMGGKHGLELKTITLFLFHTTEHVLQPVDPKHPQAIWCTPQKAIELLTFQEDKDFLKKILSSIDR